MSSTGRGAEREPDDFYETPGWCVRAILPHLPKLPGLRILEPSAGRGAIVRELLRAGADTRQIVRVEIDRGRADALLHDASAGAPEVICDNFMHDIVYADRFDLVVMNPPFSAAQEHIERALSLLAPGGRVAALLRLAFCTGAKRAGFRKAHPFDMHPLASRPSFTAEALSWMTEADLLAIRKMVKATAKVPAHLETLDEVRARLRGTDSADYAWFVFHGHLDADRNMRRAGGRFSVLEGKPDVVPAVPRPQLPLLSELPPCT